MKYIKKVLDNGMNIILVPMENTHIISMGFFVKAGSRNESDNNSGIAHFLEHMMFKGTSNRTSEQLFNELDMLGSVYNAATTAQYTYYYIYGNSNDTKKLLDIMLDIYINTEFTTKEINKERKVIIEEMRMRSDYPLMKLYSAMHKKIFAGTSLARDVIGTFDTVMNFNKKDLTDFRSALYKPENTVFVISGNLSPEPVYKIIKSVIDPLKNSPESAVLYTNERIIINKNMNDQSEPYVYIKQNNLYQQVYVIIAFPMYDLYSYEGDEINLLTQLLSGGFSSRLSKALREENGITYSSSAYPIVYSDFGLFIVQMVLNPTALIKGLQITFKELKKTKNDLMTKEELIKVVNMTSNETLFSLIKPSDISTWIGLNFLADRNFKPNLKNEINSLKKISRHDVQKVAKEIFLRDKINLFIYGNVEETNYDFIDV